MYQTNLGHFTKTLYWKYLGGGVHSCRMFSLWDVWELSYTTSRPWRSSCASPLLRDPHLCPFVLGSPRLEQWTPGAVREGALQPLCGTSVCKTSTVCDCDGCSWVIERKVAGSKQVSTVGSLPADPPPLSFLDVSSALSPWTNYQYRLLLHNQAGNTTGEATSMVLSVHWSSYICHTYLWYLRCCRRRNIIFTLFTGPWVNITTRPSRPAGLGPPKVNVLGPESLQVCGS